MKNIRRCSSRYYDIIKKHFLWKFSGWLTPSSEMNKKSRVTFKGKTQNCWIQIEEAAESMIEPSTCQPSAFVFSVEKSKRFKVSREEQGDIPMQATLWRVDQRALHCPWVLSVRRWWEGVSGHPMENRGIEIPRRVRLHVHVSRLRRKQSPVVHLRPPFNGFLVGG